jgi:hypothetical protein
LSVVPIGMGKGRPRFGEDEYDEGATIASDGKGLLDSKDGLSAGLLAKGKIVALATVDRLGSGL